MKSVLSQETKEILARISIDRKRTNLLKASEQRVLVFLVQRIPPGIKPDMLTFIGFSGSLIVLLSFILAVYVHKNYLILGVPGFLINWFGDSLDGRLAYFRKTPRKWYGFSLDLITDWLSAILIGTGYLIYTEAGGELAGFGFVVMYGWAMIIAVTRYKVTGKYTIDSGIFGPTEIRIIISAIMVAEIFVKDIMLYSAVVVSSIFFIVNIFDTVKLLKLASEKDAAEKAGKL
jgi:phosphatidylglycerophosphate synthase